MSSTIESGHNKNVANFEQMFSFITAWGTSYNPSRESIKQPALEAVLTNAGNSVKAVNALLPSYSMAVAAREVAFEPLSKISTRVLNALKSTETSSQVDDNAKTIVRKIQGKRATAKLTDEEKKALTDEGKSTKENSASQLSFESRLDNLDKLIQLLSSVPEYKPNEDELKVESLQALYDDLKDKNTAVTLASAPLSNARIVRNDTLYKPLTGLVDIAFDTKSYIKSLYGATSPQFKQVSALEFKDVK